MTIRNDGSNNLTTKCRDRELFNGLWYPALKTTEMITIGDSFDLIYIRFGLIGMCCGSALSYFCTRYTHTLSSQQETTLDTLSHTRCYEQTAHIQPTSPHRESTDYIMTLRKWWRRPGANTRLKMRFLTAGGGSAAITIQTIRDDPRLDTTTIKRQCGSPQEYRRWPSRPSQLVQSQMEMYSNFLANWQILSDYSKDC